MGLDLNEALFEIGHEKEIRVDLREKLRQAYGSKFEKGEEAARSKAVKKYIFMPSEKIVWIVVGKEKEYFVIPRLYCQCDDFYINVVIKKRAELCYHLLAQALADQLGDFETFILPDSDFIRLNNEWKKQNM
jgi:predicted nucleic acid-binding Zn finger protein